MGLKDFFTAVGYGKIVLAPVEYNQKSVGISGGRHSLSDLLFSVVFVLSFVLCSCC